MTSQRQIRRATTATQQARTLAVGELDYDTTAKRLNIHDGVNAGGTPHLNYFDDQNRQFTYASTSGTDAYTATLNKAPSAYTTGQKFEVKFLNSNTGASSINFNSLGVKNIKKKDLQSGVKVDLIDGDLIPNMIYTILYDGTDFIIESLDGGGLTSVSQGDLNTSVGSGSINAGYPINGDVCHLSYGNFNQHSSSYTGRIGRTRITNLAGSAQASFAGTTLPGGSYGFHPLTRYISPNFAYNQTYVTASPPFDMGDGEAGGFVYLLMNKTTGELEASYVADVPPWGYNGPTDIKACKICRKSGKKFRRVMKKRSTREILDGVPLEHELQEITQEIKNADMNLIPHPFEGHSSDHVPILIDPMDTRIRNMIEHQNAGGSEDIEDMILKGYLKADTDQVKRKGPKNLAIHKIKIK